MKKLLLPLTVTLLFLHQASFAQVRMGFTVGANLSNVYIKEDGIKDHGDYKPGIHFGIVTDMPVTKGISIQPGVHYISKGFKISEEGSTVSANLNYIEVPVNLVYNSQDGMGHFFAGAGPYVAMALSGKMTLNENGEKSLGKINFGNTENDDFRGLDLGAQLVAGFITSRGFMVSTFFSRGLYNLITVKTEGAWGHNQCFGIRLGYMFNSNRNNRVVDSK